MVTWCGVSGRAGRFRLLPPGGPFHCLLHSNNLQETNTWLRNVARHVDTLMHPTPASHWTPHASQLCAKSLLHTSCSGALTKPTAESMVCVPNPTVVLYEQWGDLATLKLVASSRITLDQGTYHGPRCTPACSPEFAMLAIISSQHANSSRRVLPMCYKNLTTKTSAKVLSRANQEKGNKKSAKT